MSGWAPPNTQYQMELFLKQFYRTLETHDFNAIAHFISNQTPVRLVDQYHTTASIINGKQDLQIYWEKSWNEMSSDKYIILECDWPILSQNNATCDYFFRHTTINKSNKKVSEYGGGIICVEKQDGVWKIVILQLRSLAPHCRQMAKLAYENLQKR